MKVSDIDNKNYLIIRNNIKCVIKKYADLYDSKNIKVLDVAPQVHNGVQEFFKFSKIETLDINPHSNCTYICDLCQNNSNIIPDNNYDLIFCTEVLEHTLNPFTAVNELYRLIKPNAIVITTTPFNFRIHNPYPDNWRFTENGLKVLFSKFSVTEINSIDDSNRFLMPIQYVCISKK